MKACFSADKAREINAPLQGGKRAHNLSKKKIFQTHNQLYTANQPAGRNSNFQLQILLNSKTSKQTIAGKFHSETYSIYGLRLN